MLWTTSERIHGNINVQQALAVSCNYYLYEIGWRTGIEHIDRVAKALGLGEHTGIELPEELGFRANPETKDYHYDGYNAEWYGADTISAAIGQSENRYTPIQLCNYISALANQGTRYKATFLRRVVSADYQELLYQNKPTVLEKLPISDTAYEACIEGMNLATTWSMGTSYMLYYNYPMAVCAKTGTAEHGSGGSDNASYVLFAPKDDPQIAITIYLEKGAQGGTLGKVAKVILDSYFSESGLIDTFPPENQPN
jgi:penicillin-binding protein 2